MGSGGFQNGAHKEKAERFVGVAEVRQTISELASWRSFLPFWQNAVPIVPLWDICGILKWLL